MGGGDVVGLSAISRSIARLHRTPKAAIFCRAAEQVLVMLLYGAQFSASIGCISRAD